MQNQPLVSVIIINYNGKTHLEVCLKSLQEITYTNVEIILVDNNSNDGSIEFVKQNYSHIKIIELDRNYGFAEPNNIGAKQATGEYLLFLNNDTKVTPNFVTELLKAAQHDPEVAIFQSLLLKPNGDVDSGGDFIDIYGRAYSSRNRPTVIEYILSARGASMMARKEAFWDLGGFDKNYFASFEDVDLGWRAWIYGYRVVIVPNSVVYHMGGQTIKKLSNEIQFYGIKNSLSLCLVNFETRYAIQSMVALFFSFMRRVFGISIMNNSGQVPPLPSFGRIFQGVVWVVKNFRQIISKQKAVSSRRIRSTKQLVNLGLIKPF